MLYFSIKVETEAAALSLALLLVILANELMCSRSTSPHCDSSAQVLFQLQQQREGEGAGSFSAQLPQNKALAGLGEGNDCLYMFPGHTGSYELYKQTEGNNTGLILQTQCEQTPRY